MILNTPDKIFAEVIARRDAALALYRERGDDDSHGQVVALAGLAHSIDPHRRPGGGVVMSLDYSRADVDRVTRILDASPVWVDASKIDTHALAVDILEQMTLAGHAPSTINPLLFRTTYGLDAYLRLIELHVLDDVTESVGDIVEAPDGLAVLTPLGWWEITDEQALDLVGGLGLMLRPRLTRRAEDHTAYGASAAAKRELKRPADQTNELSAIADTYA